MSTSATIARDAMMAMVATKKPPTGQYPNAGFALADLMAVWYAGMPENDLQFLDEPAVDYTWTPGNSARIVDPSHTAVALLGWAVACKAGAATPMAIHVAVDANPMLVPSSVMGGMTQDDVLAAMQAWLAAPTDDDPMRAWLPDVPTPDVFHQAAMACRAGFTAGATDDEIAAILTGYFGVKPDSGSV